MKTSTTSGFRSAAILCQSLLAISLFIARPAGAQTINADALGGPNIGERLFLETRFAEYFFTNSGGKVNTLLANGDPVMATSVSIYGNLPGPFNHYSMNCRACHMVEEHESTTNRTYADFARRSPLPDIHDGKTVTSRNTMALVNSFIPRDVPFFLHYDGQFATTRDLIINTLTGRNYGWKPTEYQTAIHHIANIIRGDNGSGGLAHQYGRWSYTQAFLGVENSQQIEPQYTIPDYNTMDVSVTDTNSYAYVSDEEILDNIADLIEQYLQTLVFSQDDYGAFNGSPYDVFLIKNGLPQQPDNGETQLHYGRRLLRLIAGLSNPQWVSDLDDGAFITNAQGQDFQFGSTELAGLEIFLADKTTLDVVTNLQQRGITTGVEVGNCIACHAPPAFTDFIFHNTGAAQEEYDSIHGSGAFMALAVPGYSQRLTNYNAYLPPTTYHPSALGTFETPPTTNNPGQVDLGLWNVFANDDFPAPQAGLQQILPQLLSVVPPQIGSVGMSENNFFFNGTNGTAGWTYYVLTTTDLTLPLADWTISATNTFDNAGHFNFTNSIAPGATRGFFALTLGTLPPDAALPATIALFKTPTVRDLNSSEPYLHTGRLNTIEDVIDFYQNVSMEARAGAIRNIDPQLNVISLDDSATIPLAAFLRALNEAAYVDIPCPCQSAPP